MTLQEIKDLIAEHPEWDTLTDEEIAIQLNQIEIKEYVPLGSDWLLEWALVNGVYQRFLGAVEHPDTPAELKYTLKGILLIIERDGTTLRLNKPEIQGMLQLLMSYNLLTQNEIDILHATAEKTIYYHEKHLGRMFTERDVQNAKALV